MLGPPRAPNNGPKIKSARHISGRRVEPTSTEFFDVLTENPEEPNPGCDPRDGRTAEQPDLRALRLLRAMDAKPPQAPADRLDQPPLRDLSRDLPDQPCAQVVTRAQRWHRPGTVDAAPPGCLARSVENREVTLRGQLRGWTVTTHARPVRSASVSQCRASAAPETAGRSITASPACGRHPRGSQRFDLWKLLDLHHLDRFYSVDLTARRGRVDSLSFANL